MSNPNISFKKAKRMQCKASILIEGLSGRGKSGLALILAKALAGNWDDVYAIDTENGSLSLYPGINSSLGEKFGEFNVGDFTSEIGYKPANYLAFREEALNSGCKVLIQDSITHAWSAKGGILDTVSSVKASSVRYQRDSYAAWGDEEVVKQKNLLYELFRDSKCHIISTVRVKEKMEYGVNDEGKNTLISMGEQQIMQSDVKYEPDLVLHMISPGTAHSHPKAKVVKSRYSILEVDEVYEFTPELCNQLKQYLEEGADPDELLEAQRKEYCAAIKEWLDNNKSAVPMWKMIKEQAGHKDTKLEELPLQAARELFNQLTAE